MYKSYYTAPHFCGAVYVILMLAQSDCGLSNKLIKKKDLKQGIMDNKDEGVKIPILEKEHYFY